MIKNSLHILCFLLLLLTCLKSVGGLTCHGGSCVAHRRDVRVSWRAHQRGNALSRVYVHVSCGETDKRAMTNCQISIPTFTHAMCLCRTQAAVWCTQFYCHIMLSLRNPTECAGSPTGENIPSSSSLYSGCHEADNIHNSLVNL